MGSSAWKGERTCSERDLAALARQLAPELEPGDRVLLEGPLGAGKTTFARLLLEALRIEQPPEGSPTFAIAHEYRLAPGARAQAVVHVDLYRIGSEAEIEERGLPGYFWDPETIVICEWASLWKSFQESVLRSERCWQLSLSFSERGAKWRKVFISVAGSARLDFMPPFSRSQAP